MQQIRNWLLNSTLTIRFLIPYVCYKIRKLMGPIKYLIAPRKCENSDVLSSAYSVRGASNSGLARFAKLVEFHNASDARGKVLPCFFAPDRSNSFSPANIMRVRKIRNLWGGTKRHRRFQMRRSLIGVAEDSPLARLNSLASHDEKKKDRNKKDQQHKTFRASKMQSATSNASYKFQIYSIFKLL